IRAGIMQLLLSLREEYGIACLLITHDFSVARYVCDNITVMYLGRFVEKAETEELIQNPIHPYTKALLQAVPVADPTREKEELPISGDIPSPIDTPSGCVFRTRCPYAIDSCADSMPELVEMRPGHKVACHRVARGEI
ncbi:MAG: ABC transporter ATP-binding protein, partial [Thermoplasmata archaeon]|nr:ABC transporter ATP-binding protein [Thermoplasmata archaeon]